MNDSTAHKQADKSHRKLGLLGVRDALYIPYDGPVDFSDFLVSLDLRAT